MSPVNSSLNLADYDTNVSSNGSHSRIVLDHTSVVLWFTVTMAICGAGTILAGCIITAFLVQKSLLRGSNILIGSILCLDLLNAAVFMPMTFIVLLLSQLGWQLQADRICQVSQFFILLLNCTANWTGAFMAINRFIAIFLPHRYEVWIRTKVLASMIVFSCTIGFGVASPPLMGFGGFYGRLYPMGSCAMSTNKGHLANAYIALGSTVPTVIQGVLYFSLALHTACGRHLFSKGQMKISLARNNIAQRRRRNVGRMVIVSYIWYLVCFLPVPIMLTYYPHEFHMPNVFIWSRTMQLSGFAGTPFIFLLLSEEYREAVRGLFRRNGQIQPYSQQVPSGPGQPLHAVGTMETK